MPASARSTIRRSSFRCCDEEGRARAGATSSPPRATATCRSTASRSPSRTISTCAACRPRRPARPLPIAPPWTRPWWRACATPAPSSSARPISTSSPPASSACARPMACRAIRSTQAHSGRIELGLGGRGRDRAGAGDARHRYRRLRPHAGAVQQYRRPQAEPRAHLQCRRGAGLPHARLRVGVRPHHRRLPRRSSPSWPASTPTTPIVAAAAAAAARRAAAADFGSACRCRASACSSATAKPRTIMRAALDRLARLGATIVDIDIEPFYETARLLYEGPWLAERYAATRAFIASSPQAMHPVTREIMLGGARPLGGRCFRGVLSARAPAPHRRGSGSPQIDLLALPTAPTLYTVEQVLADPIGLNSRLGTYTNFVNLLDLCGLAVPAALHDNAAGARPFGITLLAPGGNDGLLAAIGRQVSRRYRAAARRARPQAAPALAPCRARRRARMSARGGRRASLRHAAQSRTARPRGTVRRNHRHRAGLSPVTRCPAPTRRSPACCASRTGAAAPSRWRSGRWRRSRSAASPPRAAAAVDRLRSGSPMGASVKGFLVEAEAVNGARDISRFGGWRDFVAQEMQNTWKTSAP